MASLAEVSDINAWINLANAAGAGVINPEIFYTKQLLDMIRMAPDEYCYYKLAETIPIQNKADKLQIRRWTPLRAHTVPLKEGIPPKSDKASVEKYEVPAYQYGRYMEFTDKVDFAVVDPVIAMYTHEYSIVAMETLDLLAREALLSIANPTYAGQAANFEELTADSKPAIEDLRLIILNLQRRLIRPRTGNNFLVIVSPEVEFDWVNDPTVQQYMRINQSSYSVFSSSQIPDMFNMSFQKSLATHISGEFYKRASGASVATKHLRIYQMVQTPDPGNPTGPPLIKYNYETLDSATSPYYSKADGYELDRRTGQPASYIPSLERWDMVQYNIDHPPNAGESEWLPLLAHHIFIVGKDALIRTGLSGEDNIKTYTKPKGSAGVLDPIDQRQSIGFKINSVGFGSARLEAVQDYICVPQYAGDGGYYA